MSFNGSGVDDAELGDLAVEEVREGLPVAARGLHASMDGKVFADVGDEPSKELLMAFGGVGELAPGEEIPGLAVLDGDVIIGLGDVDPKGEFVV